MWYSRVHSYGLSTLLLYHQVHVVVLQDGYHLYLHGPPHTHARHCARHLEERFKLVNIARIDSRPANICASCGLATDHKSMPLLASPGPGDVSWAFSAALTSAVKQTVYTRDGKTRLPQFNRFPIILFVPAVLWKLFSYMSAFGVRSYRDIIEPTCQKPRHFNRARIFQPCGISVCGLSRCGQLFLCFILKT